MGPRPFNRGNRVERRPPAQTDWGGTGAGCGTQLRSGERRLLAVGATAGQHANNLQRVLRGVDLETNSPVADPQAPLTRSAPQHLRVAMPRLSKATHGPAD